MIAVPTLNFNGNCREAIQLYAKAFGGKIGVMMTYRDANDPHYNQIMREDQLDYIYHAELLLGEQRIIMSDNVDVEIGTCHSTFLTIMCDTDEQVRAAYEVLKDGSTTIFPLQATFYSSARVAFVDKFGVRWGVMKEL